MYDRKTLDLIKEYCGGHSNVNKNNKNE